MDTVSGVQGWFSTHDSQQAEVPKADCWPVLGVTGDFSTAAGGLCPELCLSVD